MQQINHISVENMRNGNVYSILRQCVPVFLIVMAGFVEETRCEDIGAGTNGYIINMNADNSVEALLELHFLYLVETNVDLSEENIDLIEKLIFHNIQNSNFNIQSDKDAAFDTDIVEIDPSPVDRINSNGFCIPTLGYTYCHVIDGVMSIQIVGSVETATERFYSIMRNTLNDEQIVDGFQSNSLEPFNGNLRYVRATEEDNRIMYPDDSDSSTMIVLLVILSVGIFCLALAVVYLLFSRFDRVQTSSNVGNRTSTGNADSRLGINAIAEGMNWLEVKSTSSSADSSSSMSSSTLSKLSRPPKIVMNVSNSVCGSSVSDISVQSLGTIESFNMNPKLEKIDEEAPSFEISLDNSESFCTSIQVQSCSTNENSEEMSMSCDSYEEEEACKKGGIADDDSNSTEFNEESTSFHTPSQSFHDTITPKRRGDANESLPFSTPLNESLCSLQSI